MKVVYFLTVPYKSSLSNEGFLAASKHNFCLSYNVPEDYENKHSAYIGVRKETIERLDIVKTKVNKLNSIIVRAERWRQCILLRS